MARRRGGGQARAANMALALRTIEGNLAFTDQAAWAWFALPTQRWAFRADGERLNLIIDTATRLSSLTRLILARVLGRRNLPAPRGRNSLSPFVAGAACLFSR